jgi:hypothetical protein
MPCVALPLLPKPICISWTWPSIPWTWPSLPTWPSVDWPVLEGQLLLIFFIAVGGFLILRLLLPVREWVDFRLLTLFDRFRRGIEHEEDDDIDVGP